ncbi:hypothetical protein TH606_05400 [Thermodesulfatator autotrophicus]|uniref:SMP-30/Gluconolactonase/LRE-like region domain-containing protein n=2 Tax=Thermodesulfatator autotrophicus TaxID=1795632 RepID=A0A177E6Y0_9BACT|nr:hypothetical protein TH606_05400 [Thermodesulfatator autotrophicus]
MSQKLLIILTIFLSCFAIKIEDVFSYKFHYQFSILKDTYDNYLSQPFSIFVDNQIERIYVCDAAENRLISYDFTGTPLKEFDAAGQLKGPIFMIKDPSGCLWIIERSINSLTFVDLKAKKFQRRFLKYKNHILLPAKLAYWKDYLFLLDQMSGLIYVIDKNLITPNKIIKPKKLKDFKGFIDIKFRKNKLWALENGGKRLIVFDLNKKTEQIFNLKGANTVLPVSFDIDNHNNIYLLDRDLKKILVFSPEGIFRKSFLKEGFRMGQVLYPSYLLISGSRLYVVDEGNGRIDVWGF